MDRRPRRYGHHPDEDPGQDLLQFQAGAVLTATLTDGDGAAAPAIDFAAATWKYYRSANNSGPWAEIFRLTEADPPATDTTAVYTASDSSTDNDVGMYLRAVASYTDRRGANKSAEYVSPYTVQQFREDNTLPVFAPAMVTREVSEGPAGQTVGAPVTATDDDGDVLNYVVQTTTPQDAPFRADPATGQITTTAALNFEAGTTTYTVTVRATDSAGGNTDAPSDADQLPDDSTVTITLLDVNEKPDFGASPGTDDAPTNISGMLADYPEDGSKGDDAAETADLTLATYSATDPEGGAVSLTLSGADADIFKLTGTVAGTRTLEFKELPDYEMPGDSDDNNVYEVTVVASDEVNAAERNATVKVTDSDEDGKIELSSQAPVIGTPVTATLTDSDGQIARVTWTWQRAPAPTTAGQTCASEAEANALTWTPAPPAPPPGTADEGTSNSYTPSRQPDPKDLEVDDKDQCLRAVADYIDRTSDADDGFLNRATSDPTTPVRDTQANKAPEFSEGTSTVRYVNENTDTGENIGHMIAVTDGDLPGDSHTYTLSGADATSFNIEPVEAGVQLQTKLPLNRETPGKAQHRVRITVKDGSGESNDTDSIDVTIMVLNEDEGPPVTGVSSHDHPENSTATIVTLRASDPERVTPIVWSKLDSATDVEDIENADIADRARFAVSQRGELSFAGSGANFEIDSASGSGDGAKNYQVVIQASDGGRETALEYFKVTVTVTNEDEAGEATWTTGTGTSENLLQFDDGTTLTASVTDPDNVVANTNAAGDVLDEDVTWEWARSSSRTGGWTVINGETNPAYTSDSQADDDDRGMYVRVRGTYTDAAGGSETAEFIAPHVVSAQLVEDNSEPAFQPTAQVRRVNEGPKGMNVGSPVRATDDDTNDVLTYSLTGTVPQVGTPGVDAFTIDRATAQITTNAALDYETAMSYEVMVLATDPADADTPTAATVTIEVQPVDEAPEFGEVDTTTPATPSNVQGMLADYTEDGQKGNTAPGTAVDPILATYTARDPEGGTVTFSLGGRDAGKFKLTGDTAGTRTVEFIDLPDFENPGDQGGNNIYEVTVIASDGRNTVEKSFTVKVLDSEEDGEISIAQQNPLIGTAITATLTDSDGDIDRVTWTWQKAEAPTTQGQTCATQEDLLTWTPEEVVTPGSMDEGTSNSYTPTADDNNMCLRAAAAYMDRTAGEVDLADDVDPSDDPNGIEFLNTAMSAPTTPVRDAPANEAPEFLEGSSTVRYVNENVDLESNVGHPVTAYDADDDELKYELSGADLASFEIGEGDGQLTTNAKLNHEANAEYTVIVTATDNAQTGPKSTSIEVTISVMDLDEKPVISSGAVAITGPTRHTVPEGMTDVGTYAVSGGDGETGTLRLTGIDAGDFSINNGVVTFRSPPDYESPDDSGRDNNYVFTVSATVGGEPVTRNVTVNVTNVDEDGVLTVSPPQPVVGSAVTATLTDEDGGITGENWWWASADTAGGVYTRIAGATSVSYTPVAADSGKFLRATVRYSDAEGSGKREMAVTANALEMMRAAGPYDADNSGTIDSTEVLQAVIDYFAGNLDSIGVLDVVTRYFEDN